MVCNNNNNNVLSEQFREILNDLIMLDIMMKRITELKDKGEISISEYNDLKQGHDETLQSLDTRLTERINRR